MGYYQFTCTGPLTLHALGTYTYRVLFCDPELETALPFKKGTPRLRIDGELEGIPVSLAWQPSRGGPLCRLPPSIRNPIFRSDI